MKKIPSQTERDMQAMNPCRLDEEFMVRLAACADGTATELTSEELAFEESLRVNNPSAVTASFSAALAELVCDTPFSVDDKIVLFHKSSSQNLRPRVSAFRRVLRSNLAAVAAVALLGGFAALMLPEQSLERPTSAQSTPNESFSDFIHSGDQFSPASFNRKLDDTRDEGVMWQGENQPHRVLRFKYIDRVTLTNEKGEAVEVEQPREEIVIIPERLD